ncbi:flagellar hook-length control protein FliK [Entomohabitans teleogrylli]|uniref:flagellar hook-length control protein FliK n=1 Tax=Entomohabitans teleogrylli TaxID=1384589 RepID=UPI00073DB2E7|nr:flagellar hook-length control protein FliK [Entomohabitans teleogrylli]
MVNILPGLIVSSPLSDEHLMPGGETGAFAADLEEKMAQLLLPETPVLLAAPPEKAPPERDPPPTAVLPALLIDIEQVAALLAPQAVPPPVADEGNELAMPLRTAQMPGDPTPLSKAMAAFSFSDGPPTPVREIAEKAPLTTEVKEPRLPAITPLREGAGRSNEAAPLAGEGRQPVKVAMTADNPAPLSASVSSPAAGVAHTASLSAAPPTATAFIAPPPGSDAWRHALGQQLAVFTRNHIHHAEIRLNPQELGVIKIHLRLNNEQVSLQAFSEHHQVRAALEAAMPTLRHALSEAGIQLSHSSVGSESAAARDDEHRPPSSARRQQEEGAHPEEFDSAADGAMGVTPRRGGINTYV